MPAARANPVPYLGDACGSRAAGERAVPSCGKAGWRQLLCLCHMPWQAYGRGRAAWHIWGCTPTSKQTINRGDCLGWQPLAVGASWFTGVYCTSAAGLWQHTKIENSWIGRGQGQASDCCAVKNGACRSRHGQKLGPARQPAGGKYTACVACKRAVDFPDRGGSKQAARLRCERPSS